MSSLMESMDTEEVRTVLMERTTCNGQRRAEMRWLMGDSSTGWASVCHIFYLVHGKRRVQAKSSVFRSPGLRFSERSSAKWAAWIEWT